MPPTRLIYASVRLDQSASALNEIFEVSRANNLRDGLTGALIVGERFYVQLLEGDRSSVSECMWRISQDARHQDLELVAVNLVPHRLFAEWGLHRIDTADIKRKLLTPFLVDGSFQPRQMPQAAIEDLCRMLSREDPQTMR